MKLSAYIILVDFILMLIFSSSAIAFTCDIDLELAYPFGLQGRQEFQNLVDFDAGEQVVAATLELEFLDSDTDNYWLDDSSLNQYFAYDYRENVAVHLDGWYVAWGERYYYEEDQADQVEDLGEVDNGVYSVIIDPYLINGDGELSIALFVDNPYWIEYTYAHSVTWPDVSLLSSRIVYEISVSEAPEPATIWMLLLGSVFLPIFRSQYKKYLKYS